VLSEIATALAKGGPATPAIDAAKAELLRAGFTKIDYVEAVDADTLRPVERAAGPTRIAGAVWLGVTRLIDNVPVKA
jgi:pantoate--beta-alanine ligase